MYAHFPGMQLERKTKDGCNDLKITLHTAYRHTGGVEAERRSFINSAVDGSYRREEPGYPWNRGLDGPKSRSARSGEEKNLLSLP
jgi:hypothetical protein